MKRHTRTIVIPIHVACVLLAFSGTATAGVIGAASHGAGEDRTAPKGAVSSALPDSVPSLAIFIPVRLHTDVPDLPPAPPRGIGEDLPGLGAGEQWTFGMLAPDGRTPLSFEDEQIRRLVTRTIEEGGRFFRDGDEPRRIHTDVPDLPSLIDPRVTHLRPVKPDVPVLDWIDRDGEKLPRMQSMTIPAPGSLVVLGLGMAAASRRRR